MDTAITPIALEIEQKAEEVRRLAAPHEAVELDRLRDETAMLQAMIAEAMRLRLLERRFDARGTAVFFPVLIETDEFCGYCLVNNLSPEGMRAKVYANFSRQQSIRVHFTSNELIEGRLVWSEPRQMGVQFDQKIDVAKVLSGFGRTALGGGSNRPARLPIACLAEISVGKRAQFVEVRDISQRGAKVATKLGQPGENVALQLDCLDERNATVRWSRSGTVGLSFSEPLSFQELAMFGQSASAGF